MDRHAMEFWDLHRRLGQCYEASRLAVSPSPGWSPVTSRSLGPPARRPLSVPRPVVPSVSIKQLLTSEHLQREVSSDSALPYQLSRIVPEPHRDYGGESHVLMAESLEQPEQLPPAPGRQVSWQDSPPDSPPDSPKISQKVSWHDSPSTPDSPKLSRKASSGLLDSQNSSPDSPRLSRKARVDAHPSGMGTLGTQSAALPFNPVPLKCWQSKAKTSANRSGTKGSRGATATSLTHEQAIQSAHDLIKASGLGASCALSPNGHFRNLWDFLGVIFLVFDAIVLPLQFVSSGFYDLIPLFVATKIQVVYWCIDLVLSFFTGYLYKGDLILDRKAIARHYLKSWFLPDLTVTAIDIGLEATGAANGANAGTRVLRLLRLFRVVRLGKLSRFASFLRDRFESEVAYTQFSLFLVIFSMMLLEHVIACGWFGIGSLDANITWLSRRGSYSSFSLQYTDSIRWAFSHLGIAGTTIEAVNELEGIYSILVGLVSLIIFSTVISSMTSLVSTLQMKRMEETQQFGLLRRFIRVNQIPDQLGQRVTRFLHYAYHERRANAQDPYILDFLPKSLEAELRLARYHEHLSKLPFLADLLSNNSLSLQEGRVVQTLAQQSVSVLDFAEDDVVFCQGTEAVASYSVMQGSMVYLQSDNSRRPPGGWISEMSLWTQWHHMGDLMSTNFSRLLAIHVKEFCHIICEAPAVQVQAHAYAVEYVEALKGDMYLCDLPPQKLEVGKQQSMLSLALKVQYPSFISFLCCSGARRARASARVSP